jgi:hypothetical protein
MGTANVVHQTLPSGQPSNLSFVGVDSIPVMFSATMVNINLLSGHDDQNKGTDKRHQKSILLYNPQYLLV